MYVLEIIDLVKDMAVRILVVKRSLVSMRKHCAFMPRIRGKSNFSKISLKGGLREN